MRIVDQVIDTLRASKSVKTINGLNTQFEVGAEASPAHQPRICLHRDRQRPQCRQHEDIRM